VLASVMRDEFKIRSELEAVYIPTGTVFRAYPYSDPNHMLESIKVNWGRARSASDYAEELRTVASQLLLERADRAARDRQSVAFARSDFFIGRHRAAGPTA
jgi:hypothetical protein